MKTVPQTSPLFLRVATDTSGRSRTAATMFRRLTFTEEPTTVMKVMTIPRA